MIARRMADMEEQRSATKRTTKNSQKTAMDVAYLDANQRTDHTEYYQRRGKTAPPQYQKMDQQDFRERVVEELERNKEQMSRLGIQLHDSAVAGRLRPESANTTRLSAPGQTTPSQPKRGESLATPREVRPSPLSHSTPLPKELAGDVPLPKASPIRHDSGRGEVLQLRQQVETLQQMVAMLTERLDVGHSLPHQQQQTSQVGNRSMLAAKAPQVTTAVPEFAGHSSDAGVEDFLERLDLYFGVVTDDDDMAKGATAAIMLTGGARAWYRTTFGERRPGYNELAAALREEYAGEVAREEARRQLESIRQETGKTEQYIDQFNRLRACVGEEVTHSGYVRLFIRGMLGEARKHVRLGDPKTMEQAVRLFRQYESARKDIQGERPGDKRGWKHKPGEHRREWSGGKGRGHGRTHEGGRGYDRNGGDRGIGRGDRGYRERRGEFGGNCFYCNQPGHRQRDCEKKRREQGATRAPRDPLNRHPNNSRF
eukprot:m.253450 g.253450  ORF g.253450 m.253450 type:complete len:484 (-) comp26718_c0_seq14:4168-5619(-)